MDKLLDMLKCIEDKGDEGEKDGGGDGGEETVGGHDGEEELGQ